ncbi:MAG: Uma2 family endonuclease [Cyanobacteria bacterium J06638_22]
MIAQPQVSSRTYTPEEYLELEIASEERHEYIGGEIIPMTGGTPNHNQILLNLAGSLNFALKRQPYRVFAADQRLWIPAQGIYTYPDVMVVQGELAYQEGRQDTLTNPVVIIEVLSKSTRGYDRTEKFVAYRTIPTIQEYVLVDQYTYRVEQYTKQSEKTWMFRVYDRPDEQLEFAAFPWAIALEDIYDKVELEAVSE